jgi:hypothetical protein
MTLYFFFRATENCFWIFFGFKLIDAMFFAGLSYQSLVFLYFLGDGVRDQGIF